MKRFRGTKGMVITLILILLVVGYYYYLSNRDFSKEEDVVITEVQDILLTDLNRNYPPSPKEVVKFFLETTKCMYNEILSDSDSSAMAEKIQEIYDDDLIANKPQEKYMKDLKSEIADFQGASCSIVNYSTSASTDVEYFEEDGYSFARLYGTLYLRVEKELKSLEQVFLLRKDENNHWKIYGWKSVEE